MLYSFEDFSRAAGDICFRVSVGGTDGGDGAGGGRKSLVTFDALPAGDLVVFGEAPFFDTKTACGMGLARGFGDCIFVTVDWVAGMSSSESESDSDSDSEGSDEDTDEDPSLCSRNWKTSTSVTCFAGSGVGGDDEAACGFTFCLEVLFRVEALLFSEIVGLATGPACVVTLETVDDVLFLASFLVDFLVRILLWSGMLIG